MVLHEIIDLVKDDISSEKLEQLIILLDQLDTEARRDIISYMRRDERNEIFNYR